MVRCDPLHPGQQTIKQHPARFKVAACGRRFGKTRLAQIMLLEKALYQGMTTWWLAPTYSMASQVWRDLKASLTPSALTTSLTNSLADSLINSSTSAMSASGLRTGATGATGIRTEAVRRPVLRPALDAVHISESEHRIDFVDTGGVIAIRSTHTPDILRGAGLDYAVLDEAAFMEPRIWPEIVRPMLLDRQGGALFISTPYGRNWFYHLYQHGLDPLEPEWAAFHYTSLDNPLIPSGEFDGVRRSTPERIWRAEYLAEFVDDAGQVFRGVRGAVYQPALPIERQPDGDYIMGVDWGRDVDFTCIAVIEAATGRLVDLERFNQVGWALQRGRLTAAAERWQPRVIWAEANSIGSVNIEALQNEGLPVRPFMTTARSKAPLIEGLALAIERAQVRLLPDDVLLSELESYTLERLPGGGYRYGAPAGLHDDTVIALALAWYGVQQTRPALDFA